MMAANLISYLVILVLARHLGPADFGGYSALSSYGLVLAVPAGALQVISTRHVVAFDTSTLRTASWVGALLATGTIVASPLLVAVLDVPFLAVVWLAISLVFTTHVGTFQGLLLGRNALRRLSGLYLVTASTRLAAVFGGAFLGLSVTGVFGLLTLAALLTWLAGALWTADIRRELAFSERLWSELAWSTSSLGAFIAMTNIDVILARSVLDAHDSGGYALASTFGRAMCWGTQFVAILLVPKMQSENRMTALRKGMLLIAALGVTGLAVIAVAPGFWIRLAGGTEYTDFATLAIACTALGVMWALVQVSIFSEIGRGRARLGVLAWIAVVAEMVIVRALPEPTAWLIASVAAGCALVVVVVGSVPGFHSAGRGERSPDRALR